LKTLNAFSQSSQMRTWFHGKLQLQELGHEQKVNAIRKLEGKNVDY